METKKLLLGFCALAAVTVATPQVFGALGSPLTDADAEAKAQRDALLAAATERLKADTLRLKNAGQEELRCIERAAWLRQRAFFSLGIDESNAEAASAEVDRIKIEIDVAKCTCFAKNKVKKLELELAEASVHKDRMSKRLEYSKLVATNYRDTAELFLSKFRQRCAWRIAFHNSRAFEEVTERGQNRQEADLVKVEQQSLEIRELEDMKLMADLDELVVEEIDNRIKEAERLHYGIKRAYEYHDDITSYAVSCSLDKWFKLTDKYRKAAAKNYCDDISGFGFKTLEGHVWAHNCLGKYEILKKKVTDALAAAKRSTYQMSTSDDN
jgi:hypothetical protein